MISSRKSQPSKSESPSASRIKGPLLAQVNDWAIGVDDFKGYLDNLRPLAEAQDLNIDDYEFKRRLLNDLVRAQILSQVAVERGIDKKEDIMSGVRDYKSSLLAATLRAEIERNIDVSFTEVQNFYGQNKHLLKRPEEIKVREIAVDTEPRARDVYKRLLDGEDFASLARQFSVIESARDGGDLGYLSYDAEVKFRRFWEEVLTREKGELSTIFRGEDGKYYILKVEDVRGGQEIPFSEVENELKEALRNDKIDKELSNIVDGFKLRGDIVVNDHFLR